MEKPNNRFEFDARRIYTMLATDEELDGVDFRVFLYLLARLDFINYQAVHQSDLAEALGRRREHISRAIRKLKRKAIIIEGLPRIGRSPALRLNPNYGK